MTQTIRKILNKGLFAAFSIQCEWPARMASPISRFTRSD